MNKRPRFDCEEHLLDLAKSGDWAKLEVAIKFAPEIKDAVARRVLAECVATMARNNEKFDKQRAEFVAQLQRT